MARIKRSERGFTLIEVILAIVILASALTVFIGLQAAVVEQTLRDQSRGFAVLAARRIMARVETEDNNLDDVDVNESLTEVIKKYGVPDDDDKSLIEMAKPYQAHFRVSPAKINIPSPDPKQQDVDLLKRIDLEISWGDTQLDKIVITYFTPIIPP